jgi:hypothetical protein
LPAARHENQPEDGGIGTHRSDNQAADEIVEAKQDEDGIKRSPQPCPFENQGMGHHGIENDARAKHPRLHDEELIGAKAGRPWQHACK